MEITEFFKCQTESPVSPETAGLGHDNGDYSYYPVHGGVDIFAPRGTEIRAVAGGHVISAQHEKYAGNVVVLIHENNVVSKYLHLERFVIEPGSSVTRGDLLGFVGNTGAVCTKNPASDGSGRCQPHVHFEVGLGLNEPYYTPDKFMHFNPLPLLSDLVKRSPVHCSSAPALTAPARRGWYVRVPLAFVPLFLRQAIISVEDKRFYCHHGLDYRGIGRAILRNLQQRRIVEGGSTITQQAARSAFFATERSWKRKAVETVVALVLEFFYSKNAILELYFNTVYWGRSSVGVQMAAWNFFRKHLLDLNFKECLFLATLPTNPLGWAVSPQEVTKREKLMDLVFSAMKKQGMIDSYISQHVQKQAYFLVDEVAI